MKIAQTLLGAMLVGLAAQATSCTKKGEPVVKQEQGKPKKAEPIAESEPCPACGMG